MELITDQISPTATTPIEIESLSGSRLQFQSNNSFLSLLQTQFNQASSKSITDFLNRYVCEGIAEPAPEKPCDCNKIAGAIFIVYPEGQQLKALMIQRAETMELCPGRIEFPGGHCETAEDAFQAALRETHEELGIEGDKLSIIGELCPVLNVESGYWVKVWLGFMKSKPALKIQASEISNVLTFNLSELLSENNFRTVQVISQGASCVTPAVVVEDSKIWGTAAVVLGELKARILGFTPSTPQ